MKIPILLLLGTAVSLASSACATAPAQSHETAAAQEETVIISDDPESRRGNYQESARPRRRPIQMFGAGHG